MRRTAVAAAFLVVAACSGGGDGDGRAGAPTTRPLTPTFAPTTLGPAPGDTASAGTAPPAGVAATTTTTAAAGAGGGPAPTPPPPVETGRIQDRVGDLTTSVEAPPRHADLAGGTLTRTGDRMELRVRFAGPAPAAEGDADHTLNVASFYDVEGDGHVDFEIWANLADVGWSASWFDDRGRGEARFGERSGIAATAEDGELVLRFSTALVGGAERFQWSLASEWGRYEVIGTPAAARDDAPDDDGAVAFPGR